MTQTTKRIWLIGASTGIGLHLCQQLLRQQHCVVASARTATHSEALKQLQAEFPKQLKCVDINLSDLDSLDNLETACQQAWQAFDGLDTWFYNVGSYEPMRLEEWNWQAFKTMNDTNYLGAVATMIALKPYFLAQGKGQWVWNISLASDFGLPYGGGYSAPKAALMNLAQSLQPELAEQNIALQVINHGFVKTRLTAKNDFPMMGLMSAEHAAEQIYRFLEKTWQKSPEQQLSTGRFELRFPWNLATVLAILKRLPHRLSLKITKGALRNKGSQND